MLSLNGKTALITGGGSGIGRAISLLFARQGASLHVLDGDEAAMQETRALILQDKGLCECHRCDVGDQGAVSAVLQEIGPLQILVNNAGVAHIGRATSTSEGDFERILRVNVKGVYNCLFAALPLMPRGSVVLNISSIAAHVGLAERFAYSASKGAVHAMTLSVARDYLKDGIRCNSLSPARVHTPFVDGFLTANYPGKEQEMFHKLSATQPIGRMAQASEIANLALFLCSDEAAFITGSDYPIDGGFITLNT